MSYGWLTESALLPTRAVPIRGVSDTSLLSLSNQIFSLQQEQQDQQQPSLRPQAARATAAGATAGVAAAAGLKTKKPSFRSRSPSEEEYHSDGASASRRGEGGGGVGCRRAEGDAAAAGPCKEAEGSGEDVSERWQSGRRSELLRATAAQKRNKPSELSSTGEQEENLYVLHASSRKAWKKPSRKSKTREQLLFEGKNVRVEERAAKDEAHCKAEKKTLAASRRRLEEKARLYEELVSGRLDCSSAPAGARLVVDFEEKLWRRSSASAPSIRDTHTTDDKEAEAPSVGEPKGEADLLSRYFSVEEQDRHQKERQDARKQRLDCLRLRLISFREAACVAAGARTAAARIPGECD